MQNSAVRVGLIILAAVAVSAAAALLILRTGPTHAGLLRPDDAETVARGKAVYAENCASCHGADLEGEPNWRRPDGDGLLPAPPHDESGHTWHHSEKLLFDLTKYGLAATAGLKDHKTRMPVYDGVLSDEDIVAALSYIKSRWPAELQLRHTEMSAQDQ